MKKSIVLLVQLVLLSHSALFSHAFNVSLEGVENLNCPAPIISSFSPETGPVNTKITLNGSLLNTLSTVDFNGITASFTIISDSEINITIPEGISDFSTITLTTNGGCSTTTTNNFTLINDTCGTTGDIYISEVYDSNGGSYGVIELYNPTSTAVDVDGVYEVQRFGDIGNATPSATIPLTGSIPALSTYSIEMGSTGNVCSGISADVTVSAGINEDDEIRLVKTGSVIDVMYTAENIGYTFIRNADAAAPSTSFNINEWLYLDNESCSDLGTHTANNNATSPTLSQPDSVSLCENENATFTVSVDSGSYTYQWKVLNSAGDWTNLSNDSNYSGVTTNTLSIANTPFSFNGLQYYCEITTTSCSLVSHAALLEVLNPEVDNLADQTACLTYSLPSLTHGNYYTGINGTGTPLFAGDIISSSQTIYIYTEVGTAPNFCSNQSNFTVTINEAPAVSTLEDQVVCGQFELPSITDGNYYTGPNGTGTALTAGDLLFTSQVVYIFNIDSTSSNNCSSESDFEVTVYPATDFTLDTSNISINGDTLTVTMTDSSISYLYAIDNADFQTEAVMSSIADGLHTLYVQDANGCVIKSIDFEISTLTETLFIPQGFSPNNDGKNDWFNIQGLYDVFPNHNLKIYNRYGSLIFEGNNNNKWYGSANRGLLKTNKTLPVGTYFYVLQLNETGANSRSFTGWVYLNK
ncbi:T9SS type B sorting domain-containing protein [Winogradskyella arenosi]|uniref:Gliding motility-associated-like protein n=1 Tax=Winogradskyella arenosi TaxID=533325 RepID=A0A368ZF99_9FLAO|nr:gliding motility-associated C-terminal domain-containing protein [Winogradskyella arenosi]RCW92196.1 gliding motility-associated-like protein [Winogradskyella arenosi]